MQLDFVLIRVIYIYIIEKKCNSYQLMCQKEAIWNLSRTSKVVEELLTIIFCNDVLELLRLLVRNVRWCLVCDSEGGRFGSFPGPHHMNHTDEIWQAIPQAVCSQSLIVVWKGNILEGTDGKAPRNQGLAFKQLCTV